MLIGGILGNLFDRIFYGYVIDYLDFYIFNYNYPVFNIADMCIVISVCLLIVDMIRGGKNESNS
jgi:signal peptidase II